MTLGEKLKNILADKSITVSELSKISGIPKTTIYSIISRESKSARYDVIAKLANALECEPGSLMNWEEKAKTIKHSYEALEARYRFNELVEKFIRYLGYEIEQDFAKDKNGDATILLDNCGDGFEIRKCDYEKFVNDSFSFVYLQFNELIKEENLVKSDMFVERYEPKSVEESVQNFFFKKSK